MTSEHYFNITLYTHMLRPNNCITRPTWLPRGLLSLQVSRALDYSLYGESIACTWRAQRPVIGQCEVTMSHNCYTRNAVGRCGRCVSFSAITTRMLCTTFRASTFPVYYLFLLYVATVTAWLYWSILLFVVRISVETLDSLHHRLVCFYFPNEIVAAKSADPVW